MEQASNLIRSNVCVTIASVGIAHLRGKYCSLQGVALDQNTNAFSLNLTTLQFLVL